MELINFFSCSFPMFNNFASLLTIIGFCITLFIAFQVKTIKQSFLRKAQLPELLKQLENEKVQMYTILSKNGKFDKKEKHVLSNLSTIKGILDNTEKKLPKGSKTKINELIKSLKDGKYSSKLITKIDESSSWKIYYELNEMYKHLQLLLSDTTWD